MFTFSAHLRSLGGNYASRLERVYTLTQDKLAKDKIVTPQAPFVRLTLATLTPSDLENQEGRKKVKAKPGEKRRRLCRRLLASPSLPLFGVFYISQFVRDKIGGG